MPQFAIPRFRDPGRTHYPRTCGIVAACLLLAQFLSACAIPHRPVAPAALPPPHRMQVGLCEDYPRERRNLALARQDLIACRDSGATVLRISLSWLEMEPEPGKYDFSFWDEFIALATDEFHIRLIPYICYTPRWAASDSGPEFWHSPPRDTADFARFMRTVVLRYKHRIHSWELWNEPDNPAYWTGSRAQFAALIKAGSTAVRAADSSAKVVLGGIAAYTGFVADMFRDFQVSPAVDVVNIHAYFETWHGDAIESLPEYIGKVHDLIAQYGDGQELWLAEVGYSDFRKSASGYVSDQYAARFSFEHQAAYQADVLLRCAALAASTGQVDLLAWYRINDLPEEVQVIGDRNNRHLGIRDVQGRRKPAFGALRTATALFNRPVRCMDGQLLALRSLTSTAQVHCFEAAGETDVIAWLRTTRPGAGALPAHGDEAAPPAQRLWLDWRDTSFAPGRLKVSDWTPLDLESNHTILLRFATPDWSAAGDE